MQPETYQATENMQLFFRKLLDLKKEMKDHLDESRIEHEKFIQEMYQKLDSTIKESE